MNCYTFKKIQFKKGIYDDSIDATYIITMEDSIDRHKNINEQLKNIHPTKIVYIVFNKGFKKCEKKLIKNKTNIDLIHCNLTLFKHSIDKKYSNILVLEDDFIIEEPAKDVDNIRKVNEFCLNHKDRNYSLSLGSIPTLLLPYSFNFNILYLGFGAQAMIYSNKYRLNLIKNEDKVYECEDWDVYMNYKLNNYLYYRPLITQIFPETENQRNWPDSYGITFLAIDISRALNLDKKTQPGYNIVYITVYSISIILVCLSIFLIYKLIRFIIKKI